MGFLRAATMTVSSFVLAGCASRQTAPAVPAQNVRMDSEVLEEFLEGIVDYVRLHRKLTEQIPIAAPSWSAQQIADRQRALTVAIRNARRDKKQGNIFEPEVENAFRHVLTTALTGPDAAGLLHEIHSGNPKTEGVPQQRNPQSEPMKNVPLRVNAYYPDDAPLSSVPPSLLLKLPALPEEVRYRFVGRHLILRDAEANVILDFIRDAVPDPSIPR